MGENSITMISTEEVQAFYEEFLQALKSGDTTSLEQIYADDYLLVRPNGDTFGKEEILADLRPHSMRFTASTVPTSTLCPFGPIEAFSDGISKPNHIILNERFTSSRLY